jgi:hypothetical protein
MKRHVENPVKKFHSFTSLSRSKFFIDGDTVFPLSKYNIFSFPSGYSVAAYVYISSSSPFHLFFNNVL